jgi:hypothetical protein
VTVDRARDQGCLGEAVTEETPPFVIRLDIAPGEPLPGPIMRVRPVDHGQTIPGVPASLIGPSPRRIPIGLR